MFWGHQHSLERVSWDRASPTHEWVLWSFWTGFNKKLNVTLPAAQHRSYADASHAFYHIDVDEGVLALWQGAGRIIVRAMVLNMEMLTSYGQSAQFFLFIQEVWDVSAFGSNSRAHSFSDGFGGFDPVSRDSQVLRNDGGRSFRIMESGLECVSLMSPL